VAVVGYSERYLSVQEVVSVPKKDEQFSIKLNGPSSVTISGTLMIEDPLFYSAFYKAKINGVEPREFFEEALRLGVYGMAEARIATFLRSAERELDSGLEQLKLIFRLKKEEDKGTAKGTVFEEEVLEEIQGFITASEWGDQISGTAAAVGALEDRKVGDLLAIIEASDLSIAIEIKSGKEVALGDTQDLDFRDNKDPVKQAGETAHGQMLLAMANRDAHISIIVFDRANCHRSIAVLQDDVTFFPELPGWVVKVGRAEGDFAPLRLAYSIARQLALLQIRRVSGESMNLITKRILRDLSVLSQLDSALKEVRKGADTSIKGVEKIEKLISKTTASVERTQTILGRILSGVVPTPEEWKDYFAEPAVIVQSTEK